MLPISAVVTAGNVLETRAKKDEVAALFGRVFQMFPLSAYVLFNFEYEVYHALFWKGVDQASLASKEWPEAFSWRTGVRTPLERAAFAEVWAPRITSVMALTILALPFVCRGVSVICKKLSFTTLASLVDRAGGVADTVAKVVNIALIALALESALLVGNVPLAVTCSSLLLINALAYGARMIDSLGQKAKIPSDLSV